MRLFGTDGVRGVAGEPPMTVETAMQLGQAVAYPCLERRGEGARIVIGKDTRLSGYMFETALAAGICSMGVDVWLCGPLPTPGIAYLTASMRADAGLVISASHNPYQDNGIKIFAGNGFKLPDAREAEIERLMGSRTLLRGRATATGVGKAFRIDDSRGRYVAFLKSVFPRELALDGLRIVVDCAHGACYRVAPAVFQELGAKVFPLGVDPDGRNINLHCGALAPQAAAEAVARHGADLAVALDGDGDRAVLVDERGKILDGDEVMAILALRMLGEGELARKTLVATVMSNIGLERALERHGGRLLRTQVGDRYVVEAMRKGGYNLGGEQSGHIVDLGRSTTGDGVLTTLRILEIMVREKKTLSALRAAMTLTPQVLVNVPVRARALAEKAGRAAQVGKVVRQVEDALGREGRVLVRASGTEPKVRVMIEGPGAARIRAYAEEIVRAIERATA
jgi:phosphoglucosamine mutase